jgi:hypothetical protein
MQKTLLFSALVAALFCFTDCKKKKTDTGPQPTGDFQPITTGSEWNYTVTSGATSSSYKLTATNRDSVVNGRSYKVMTNSAGPNEYYNKTGSDYYRFAKLAEFNNQAIDLLYLKDNLAKGQNWIETKTISVTQPPPVGPVPVSAKVTFTVAEKGIDYTVSGKTYKDVIKITAVPEFTALVLGSPTAIPSTSDLQYYYARTVGLIYSKTVITIPSASINNSSETTLTSAVIK